MEQVESNQEVPQVEPQVSVQETEKQESIRRTNDIAREAYSKMQGFDTNDSIPIGNEPTAMPQREEVQIPSIPSNISPLDALSKEVEESQYEGDNVKAKAGFEGLKSKYKEKIEAYKQEFSGVQSELSELKAKLEQANGFQKEAERVKDLELRLQEAEARAEQKAKEAEENSYYRLKHDAKSDPRVVKAYVELSLIHI